MDFTNVTLKNDTTPPLQFGKDADNCVKSFGKIVKSCYYDYGPESFRLGLVATSPAAIFSLTRGGRSALQGLDFVGGSDPNTGLPLITQSSILILQQVKLLREQSGVRVIILIDRSGEGPIADPSVVNALEGVNIVVTDNAGSDFIVQVNDNDRHNNNNNNNKSEDADDTQPFNRIRDFPEGSTSYVQYPIVQDDRNGRKVLLVNSHQQYSHIGNLIVEYDLVTGDLLGWDEVKSGPIATTKDNVVRMTSYLNNIIIKSSVNDDTGSVGERVITEDALYVPDVVNIFDQLSSTPIIENAYTTLAITNHPLVRPGVFILESNISRLISDAYLWYGKRQLVQLIQQQESDTTIVDDNNIVNIPVISLKNFGGIRDNIIGPNVIRLSVQSTLPFDNKLTLIRLRLDHLLAALENGFSGNVNSSGRRPGLSGLKVSVDTTKPSLQGYKSVTTPSQVKYVAIILDKDAEDEEDDSNTENLLVLVDDFQVMVPSSMIEETFVIMATADYLVGGGDQYVSLTPISDNSDDRNESIASATSSGGSTILLNTGIGEQQVVEDYITVGLDGVIDIEEPPINPNIFPGEID